MIRPAIHMELFLSPHADDVVLSCPGAVLAARRPVIVTVFGADPVRHAEDHAAAAELGAQVLHLGLPEAPERSSRHRSLAGLLGARPTPVPGLAELLQEVVDRLRPARLWAPLGVGGHVDHVVLHAAASQIRRTGMATRLYEDRPYALIAGAVAARWRRLGVDVPLDLAAARAAHAEAPWVRHFQRDRADAERVLYATLLPRRRPRRRLPASELHTLPDPDRARTAIDAYRSQALFTAPVLGAVGQERWWSAVARTG